MRYLVTGGAGFIGSHLTDALARRGDAVTVLDDLSTGDDRNLDEIRTTDSVELVRGTALDARLTDTLVSRSDVVVHLAATVGVELVVQDPLAALKNNILGTETVLEACARHGAHALNTSTSEIPRKK